MSNATAEQNQEQHIFEGLSREIFDQKNEAGYMTGTVKGLSEELIRKISADKKEPEWMLEYRLDSLRVFNEKPMPQWGPDLSGLDLDDITYYAPLGSVAPGGEKSWDEVPEDIKRTFDRLGIPEAERKVLAGVGAQYESEVVYHSLKKEWEDLGVIFEDMDVAVQKYPELVKEYFMKCVPNTDHKFAALHGAVWSGGTFLYIPKGVKLKEPVQAYFRMNAPGVGQFEHTLIVVEEDAEVHYIEGCSAPKYDQSALHAGCVEVFLKANSKARYSSVENWSRNTYNLNTKRAIVDAHGHMEWVGGNMGSGVTMLYPASILRGPGASADHLGIAFANEGQVQDTGAKIYHMAPHTRSNILMKSLSKGGGRSMFRGYIEVAPHATDTVINSCCDALILDDVSISDTFPDIRVNNDEVNIMHEATAGNIKEDDIFYFMARGMGEDDAKAMIVNGFISPIVKELPLEYAIEMNKLIELEMEGSVG